MKQHREQNTTQMKHARKHAKHLQIIIIKSLQIKVSHALLQVDQIILALT